MKKTMDGKPTQLHTDLMTLTNIELLEYGTKLRRVTVLENELLQRLEQLLNERENVKVAYYS